MNRRSFSSSLKPSQRFQLWKRRFIQNYLTTQDIQGLGSLEDAHKHNKSSVVAQLDLTPDIQTYGQEKKLSSAFQWPFLTDQKFNKHIQAYMFSFKNIYSPNINSSNLMFFTGPTKCGKSWLLRHNLEKFSSAQSANPVVFHFDFNDKTSVNAHLSFDMFLVEFERMLISQIVRNQTSLFGLDPESTKQKLKPIQEIYQVATKFYDKQLLEHSFAKTLNRALEQGSTFAFSVNTQASDDAGSAIAELGEMLQKYKGREYGKAIFANDFQKLTKLIARASPECQVDGKGCQVKSALLLIYDVCIQKEMNRRKKDYMHQHMHRDGIDCLNYFFDLINHCAGYTDKYYNEHHKRISMNDLAQKYKSEREKHEETNFKDSELLGDKYPHCLLVMEGVQRLFTMSSAGSLPLDYLDTLVLRLNTGHDGNWYRNHFPVILETNKSRYFNELIYDDMMTSEYTFPTVEFTGYEAKQLGEQLGHIFNKDQMNEVNLKVGKSIFFNHLFVESVVKRFSQGGSKQQTFGHMLAKVDGSSADSKDNIDPAFKAVRKEFEHRVNKLFVHPKLGHLLDNNEIDFAIMQVFEQILQFQAHQTKGIYAQYEVITSPLFEALFDCNIIWKSKYYAYFCFEHHLYATCIQEWLSQRYNQMNRYEKVLYYLYKKQNGLVIGRNGVGKRDPRNENSERAFKLSPQWELAELYYEIKERDENVDYA